LLYIPALLIATGWLVDYGIYWTWGQVPLDQLSDGLVRRIGLATLITKVVIYAMSTWILLCAEGATSRSRIIPGALASLMLVLETWVRWQSILWGDLPTRTAAALRLTPLEYILVPVATVCMAAALWGVWRYLRPA
jgi:hypothetical protein